MNERIQKLAEESGIMHTSMSDAEWIKQGRLVRKFAELIVGECAERLLHDVKLTDIQTTRCVASIKEHFGIFRMMKYASVVLDMDENRTVWQVMIFDEDDNLLEMRPFRDREDAEEYAALFEARQ